MTDGNGVAADGFAHSGRAVIVGAPLARIEAHIALGALARRLVGPRLVTDPPPYRDNASLRGPENLFVEFDGLR